MLFHGSLDIDEASMDEFLLKNYDIQSGNINVSKRQYEVRAALRNLLEYRRYGKSETIIRRGSRICRGLSLSEL